MLPNTWVEVSRQRYNKVEVNDTARPVKINTDEGEMEDILYIDYFFKCWILSKPVDEEATNYNSGLENGNKIEYYSKYGFGDNDNVSVRNKIKDIISSMSYLSPIEPELDINEKI